MKQEALTPVKGKYLGILVAMLWLAASAMLIVTHLGQPNLSGFGQLAGVLFILGFITYLGRIQPNAVDLPDIQPIMFPRLGYGKMMLLILGVLVFLFLVGIVLHPSLVLIAALTCIAVWVIITRRRNVSQQLVILGLIAGGLCLLLSGFSGRLDGFQGFYLACIPILFIAGGLLTKITGLTHIHSVEGKWGMALRGFLWACVLALPVALLNVSYGSHTADAWVDQFWEPWVALVPGIAEETWARLFMLTLLYSLLRPQTNQRPTRALVAAVLIAAFTHALSHLPGTMVFSPAALQMLITGLLFGVPMGLLFVKFDFEHAVGYHFFIDFVRFLVAL